MILRRVKAFMFILDYVGNSEYKKYQRLQRFFKKICAEYLFANTSTENDNSNI